MLVLGDVMVDEYIWGGAAHLARSSRPDRGGQFPDRAARWRGQRRRRVVALECGALLAGVVGDDLAAKRLREAVASKSIDLVRG